MVTLTPGQPVTTIKPVILVENELPAGQYRFQLVVTDEAGWRAPRRSCWSSSAGRSVRESPSSTATGR